MRFFHVDTFNHEKLPILIVYWIYCTIFLKKQFSPILEGSGDSLNYEKLQMNVWVGSIPDYAARKRKGTLRGQIKITLSRWFVKNILNVRTSADFWFLVLLISYLAAPQPTLGHWRGTSTSLTHRSLRAS